MASIVSMTAALKHYAGVASGSLDLARGRAFSGPLHAQIGICDPCNHRCVMCWDHPPPERESAATRDRFGGAREEVMSLAVFRSIVEDLHALGTRRIDLVGRGEPLLNPAVVDMVAHAKSLGMLVTLCTNASRLTGELSGQFVAVGLDRLNVSLNSGTPETYPRIHVTETPEAYRTVKRYLRGLTERRSAAKRSSPHLRLSFVISRRNFFEIEQMVEVAAEVGADETMFVHTVVHEATPDLALSREQYQELLAAIEGVRDKALSLGVETNLNTFVATVPTYLSEPSAGPPVVPCYVGWFFTNILANGSVMPCCQCSKPIDRVGPNRRFKDIWRSQRYRTFRVAAKGLPEAGGEILDGCECDRCMLRARNVSFHNLLHPLNSIEIGGKAQLFKVRDLLRLKKADD